MKTRITNFLLMFALICFALTGLAGCGNNTKTESTKQNETKDVSDEKVENKTEEPVEIDFFIAASLNNVMEEIKADYEKEHPNVNIVFNADSSGTLQKQIEEGADCQLFFSAATKQMNALADEGLVNKDNIKDLLENEVVLIKAKGTETAVTGFDNITDAKNMALANEDVPVGQYAREIFNNIGNMDTVNKMEINSCQNVTAVLSAVAEGSNEVGVVYATDAKSAEDSVEVIATCPKEYYTTPCVYPVGIVDSKTATDAQIEAAKDLFEYLQTEDALSLFENYGFKID
ncbi:molybdate transport system substrate-binding protein [Acetitomaculum ruminis DSM 5522]|uniref:Molybdate-binding protein ModA n=1 Tax=Acetitomaculum ruminis DSM 5522 TaxID=1120918 RepID=A0A1I0VND3_9FIRM|nr:molybdate ABC transporter substrate-binding protein [Acetitomaculum ruminis]SFA77748.1 molybdate transport system substrate-binding protein [Acetitomaculum ruminis DSM 5522]